jgi:uncharacterized membrane protein YedE/YeeE
MRALIGLAAGLLFGTGLCVSGMTQPDKVLGFLDLAGAWDPSLAFVMAGGLAVAFAAFRVARSGTHALTGDAIQIPNLTAIDAPLAVGSVIFGIGWGLAGVCPGPAIVDLGALHEQALVFVLAMAAGMVGYAFTGRLAAATARPIEQDA